MSQLKTCSENNGNVNLQPDLQVFGATDMGKRRLENQDHFVVADLHKGLAIQQASVRFEPQERCSQSMGKLMIVADGIAGAQAGEYASQLAVRQLCRFLLNSMHWMMDPQEPEMNQFVEDLKRAAFDSHQAVRNDAEQDPSHFGMGTTLTVAHLAWPMLHVLHIGDCRCYLLHRGQLIRITTDQTIAQYLVEQGVLDEPSIASSPFRNVLWNSIGGENDPKAMVYRQRLEPGDRLLLCSDGVSKYWPDADLKQILISGGSAETVCRQIISSCNRMGGSDNITAIVATSDASNDHSDPSADSA